MKKLTEILREYSENNPDVTLLAIASYPEDGNCSSSLVGDHEALLESLVTVLSDNDEVLDLVREAFGIVIMEKIEATIETKNLLDDLGFETEG